MKKDKVLVLLDSGYDKDEIDEFSDDEVSEVARLIERGYTKDEIIEMD